MVSHQKDSQPSALGHAQTAQSASIAVLAITWTFECHTLHSILHEKDPQSCHKVIHAQECLALQLTRSSNPCVAPLTPTALSALHVVDMQMLALPAQSWHPFYGPGLMKQDSHHSHIHSCRERTRHTFGLF